MIRSFRWSMTAVGLVFMLSVPAGGHSFAADDSSSDADGGFHNKVAQSSAVMIRVPTNAAGEEDTNAAEMHLVTTAPATTPTGPALATIWGSALDVSRQPVLDSSTSTDSSTWYGWNNYYGYGWRSGYYYNYRPYYSYYSGYGSPYYYNYGYPSYYNYYGNYGNYYGYNYYYYPRYW